MLGERLVGLGSSSLLTEGLVTTENGVFTAGAGLNIVGVTSNSPTLSRVEVNLVEFRGNEGLTFFNIRGNGNISNGIGSVSSEGNGLDIEVQNRVGVRNIDEVVSNTFLIRSAD